MAVRRQQFGQIGAAAAKPAVYRCRFILGGRGLGGTTIAAEA